MTRSLLYLIFLIALTPACLCAQVGQCSAQQKKKLGDSDYAQRSIRLICDSEVLAAENKLSNSVGYSQCELNFLTYLLQDANRAVVLISHDKLAIDIWQKKLNVESHSEAEVLQHIVYADQFEALLGAMINAATSLADPSPLYLCPGVPEQLRQNTFNQRKKLSDILLAHAQDLTSYKAAIAKNKRIKVIGYDATETKTPNSGCCVFSADLYPNRWSLGLCRVRSRAENPARA
jgi:hypothetical protein